MKVEDILKEENDQKVFRCVIGCSDIFDEEKDLIVCVDSCGGITLENYEDAWDENTYTEQVTRVCYEIDVSEFEGRLDKWKTNIQDVYSYENLDDLNVLYDELIEYQKLDALLRVFYEVNDDKLYICVLDEFPDYMTPTLVGHAVLRHHTDWSEHLRYQDWLAYSFKKCVVKVNRKEFEKIRKLPFITESFENSTLSGEVSCVTVIAHKDEHKVLKYAKLWKPTNQDLET